MTRFFLIIAVVLLSFNGIGQSVKKVNYREDVSKGVKEISKRYGGLDNKHLSEAVLYRLVKKKYFNGKPIHDSLVRLSISEIYYYNSGDVVNNINSWMQLLMKYSNYCTDKELEAANRKIAEAYFKIKNYILAQNFFIKSLKYNNEELRSYVYSQIGSTYLVQGDIKSAMKWYEKAVDTAVKPDRKVAHLNSLGYVSFVGENYVESRKYYQKALDEYSKFSHEVGAVQYLIIQSNLATLSFALNKTEEGFEILEGILNDTTFKNEGDWLKVEVYTKLTEAYVDDKACDKASYYLGLLKDVLPKDQHGSDYLTYLKLKVRHASACNLPGVDRLFEEFINEQKENEREELKLSNIVEDIQRSVYEDQLLLVSSNLKLKESSEKILEVSNARLIRLFWISGALSVLIIFLLVFFYLQKGSRQKRTESLLKLRSELLSEQERSSMLQIKMAEQEMENKRLELGQILNSIDKNSSLIEGIVQRLEFIKGKEGDVKEDLSQLLHFIRTLNKSDQMNELIEANADLLGSGFKEKMEKLYPDLTSSEIQLMILIRLGLSAKEMAQLKNVEPSSIRIFKHRLKSKLNLNKTEDLTSFIQQI